MEVFQQALLIEEFLENEGRLPNDLSEAGDPFSEVEYNRIDARAYRLGFAGQGGRVEYVSTEPLECVPWEFPPGHKAGGMTMETRGDVRGLRRQARVQGFTLIELLTVMVVLSILAGIALPRLRGAILKAEAADVLGDLNVVKVAVLTYQSDHNAWPRRSRSGPDPFGAGGVSSRWVRLPEGRLRSGLRQLVGNRGVAFNIGVTFTAQNQELGLAVMELVGSNIWSDGQSKFTWIIDG